MKRMILAIFLTFLNFKNITSNSIFQLIPLLLFISVFIENVIIKRNTYNFFNRSFLFLHLFVIIVLISILRTKHPNISTQLVFFKFLSFLFFILTFFGFLNSKKDSINFTKLFIYVVHLPLVLYISVNLFFWLLDFKVDGYDIGNSVMISSLGISQSRVGFLFANGINSYGTVLGLFLTLTLIFYDNSSKYKKYFIYSVFISFLSLMLTDSRGPLFISIIIFLVIKFLKNRRKAPKIILIIPFLGFIGPFLLLSVLSFLATTSYGEVLSRSSGDLESGNSRAVIWFFSFRDFLTVNPINHFFGYGEFGHYASGASKYYSSVFGHMAEDALLVHPHNTFLSIAFDLGYLGLFFYLITQIYVANFIVKYWGIYKNITLILLGNLIYINFIGITETMFGFYYKNTIELFFMIHAFAFVIIYNSKKNNKTCLILKD
jgi:O-antigen ligase